MSSAYIFNLKLYPEKSTPHISALERIAQANSSRAIMKSRGLTGKPCLTPLWRSKGLEIKPLVLTEESGEL